MTGADIDLADLWRRTLLALESAGVSPSERAFVGFARLMAVIEQTALIAVPNDYTKKVLESCLLYTSRQQAGGGHLVVHDLALEGGHVG